MTEEDTGQETQHDTGQETRHENEKSLRERLEKMSVGKIAWLIVRLIGLLLLTVLKYLLRLVLKGIVYVYQGIRHTCHRIKVFWNSNSTQEKVRKLRIHIRLGLRSTGRGLKKAGRWCWKWLRKGLRWTLRMLLLGIIYTWKGLVWLGKASLNAIIHIGPTLRRLGYLIKVGYQQMIVGLWHLCRRIRLRHLKNKRAWRRYRLNGGLKGLMIGTAGSLRNSISRFMEEDEVTETADSPAQEENEGEEEMEEEEDEIGKYVKPDENDSKATALGKKIFTSLKDIIDEK